MFHLCANFGSLANVGSNFDLVPVADGIMQIQNAHFVPSFDLELCQSYASGANLLRARLNSGTIRQTNPSYIAPFNVAALPPSTPPIMERWENPLLLKRQEELIVEVSHTAVGPDAVFVLHWLRSGLWPVPQGRPYIVRLTSTTAAVANVWTLLSLVQETGLPVGNYAVIGAVHSSANGIAFRLTFDGQYPRPGGLSGASIANIPPRQQLLGRYGTWGIFNTVTIPRAEVLANGADAVHELWLAVIKVDDLGAPPLPSNPWGGAYMAPR